MHFSADGFVSTSPCHSASPQVSTSTAGGKLEIAVTFHENTGDIPMLGIHYCFDYGDHQCSQVRAIKI